jgi:hypothetical protein
MAHAMTSPTQSKLAQGIFFSLCLFFFFSSDGLLQVASPIPLIQEPSDSHRARQRSADSPRVFSWVRSLPLPVPHHACQHNVYSMRQTNSPSMIISHHMISSPSSGRWPSADPAHHPQWNIPTGEICEWSQGCQQMIRWADINLALFFFFASIC